MYPQKYRVSQKNIENIVFTVESKLNMAASQ